MLDVLNFYGHGYAFMSLIIKCKSQGLFELLKGKKSLVLKAVANELNTNEGYLFLALHLLDLLSDLPKNEHKKNCLILKAGENEKS